VKKFLALLGVISILGLTGCGKMDSAATIGDVTISQAAAQAVVDEILAERAKIDTSQMQLTTGAELNRGELRFAIITQLFDEIAKELKLEVTPTQIEQRKAELIAQVGGESELPRNLVAANIAPSNFDEYVKAIMTSDLIAEALRQSGVPDDQLSARIGQLVTAKAKELKVTVNPRYGVWDIEQGDIVAKDSAESAVVPSNK
jgi:FKBP-type peptidyl-prolyl cis-trans isomerase (trigger factor)